MDAHVLNLAIPALRRTCGRPTPQLLWIVDSYAFLVAGCLMTMGALGDRVGRRRLLLIGAAGFGAASLLAAFATSPAMLIAARVLLGITGATLMPSTLALIRVMFTDPRQRTTAFGVWTASFALGGVLAPVVAGILLRHFWWGSVFLVRRAADAVLLALGRVLLPESATRGRARRHRRRRAVPGRRARRGLRAQAGGPGRRRSGRRHRARDRALPRGGVPAPPAPAGRPVDRPRAVPPPRLLAAARGERGVLLRPLRHAVLHRPVPPARARALGARSRPLDDPLGAGLPGRLRARSRWRRIGSGPRGR